MSPAMIALIIKLIDLAAAGIVFAAQREHYERLRDDIERFVREGREPTDDEFVAIMARSAEATERIRQAVGNKRRQETEPT